MAVVLDGKQVKDGSIEEVDLSTAVANKLIPSPDGVTDGYVLTKDEASTGKRKWAAGGGGSADVWRLSPADKPPDSPHTKNDEFTTSDSLPGGGSAIWTWQNQGSSTVSIQGKKLKLQADWASGYSMRALVQAAPAGAFTVTSKLRLSSANANYRRACLLILNSGSSYKHVGIGPFWNGSPYMHEVRGTSLVLFGGETTFSVFYGAWKADFLPMYFQIAFDGSNTLTYKMSMDGLNWITVGTQTVSSWPGSITHIGVGVDHEGANGGTEVCGIFEWFRVNWTPDY